MDRRAPPACVSRALHPALVRVVRGSRPKFRNILATKTSCALKCVARSGLWRFLRRAGATTNPRNAVRATAPRPMALAESASMPQAARTCLRMAPSRTQPIEDGQRRFLCTRRQVSRGTDARWAPLLASACRDELAPHLHKHSMRAEKPLREADAARVRVEEIQVRFEELLRVRADHFFHARSGKVFGARRIRRALAN